MLAFTLLTRSVESTMANRPAARPHSFDEPFAQLELHLTDPVQARYEVARPLRLGQPLTATERAQQTQKHFHNCPYLS